MRQESLRAHNLALAFRQIVACGGRPISRIELADQTGLTRPTITRIVDELLTGRLIAESGTTPYRGPGRPRVGLVLSRQGPAGLGLDIRADLVAACLVDLTGTVRHLAFRPRGPVSEVIDALGVLAAEAMAVAAAADLRVVRVTLAVPGAVSEGSLVRFAPLLGWREIDAGALLSARLSPQPFVGTTVRAPDPPAGPTAAGTTVDAPELPVRSSAAETTVDAPELPARPTAAGTTVDAAGLPARPRGAGSTAAAQGPLAGPTAVGSRVADDGSAPPGPIGWAGPHAGTVPPVGVDNEANLAALAELYSGEHADFAYVSGALDLGAGIVLDGRLLRGARGWSGELGHVTVYPDGRPCACGAQGCLHAYAGLDVLRAAASRSGPPAAGHVDPPAVDAGRAGLPVTAPGGVDLLAAADAGSPEMLAALETAGTALGIALAGLVNLVDVGTILLGGGYALLASWLTAPIEAELGRRALSSRWAPIEVRPAQLGPDAAVIGAALTSIEDVRRDPSSWLTKA
ncbi:ROK family transcriptional regulator [Catenuloplanes japonicus]|uniref:ROK family transcriptional regulator n=1 Tax=Catenuloplanes japonicus TaxID=33876 RepID=UPI00068FD1A0|nr:ROK family transcriptional regulator [Catenuloplanes japonicus]